MKSKYFLVAWLMIFSLFSYADGHANAHAQGDSKQAFCHDVWDGLLKRHVVNLEGNHSTAVSYAGFASEKDELGRYLKQMSQVTQTEFDSWTKEAQLAFLINAYNAWTVELVLSDYQNIKSIKELGSVFRSPWKKSFIPLFGDSLSLDDLEHGLIRGSDRYNDYRIHFAVNCASIGCPALRNEAFTAEQIDEQLDEQTRRFLSDKTRNRVEGKKIKLSSIFKWYKKDFERGWLGISDFNVFLAKHADDLSLTSDQVVALKRGDFDIDYLKYDWNLNRIQPQNN